MGLILNYIIRKPRRYAKSTYQDRERPNKHEEQGLPKIGISEDWYAEEKEHRTKESRYWRNQAIYNVGIGALTLIAVGAAIAAAVVAFVAYQEARRQAEAAIEANTHAQRPFVLITGLRLDQSAIGASGALPYLFVRVVAQNNGNTPTKNMRLVMVGPATSAYDPELAYQNPPNAVTRWRVSLPPHFNGSLPWGQAGIPMSAFRQTVVQGRMPYFIFGAAHYWDRFTDSKEHITKFCFAIAVLMSDESVPSYEPCVYWNCADDDCEADDQEYKQELRKRNSRPDPK
jgi:hypothetical protein